MISCLLLLLMFFSCYQIVALSISFPVFLCQVRMVANIEIQQVFQQVSTSVNSVSNEPERKAAVQSATGAGVSTHTATGMLTS